jgi:HAD superfamily phosphatase (TIGR01668 family)
MTALLRAFEPFRVVSSVADIDYEELWDLGVRGIVFDLENTLALYRADGLVDGNVEMLRRLQTRGFAIGIVSNSTRTWVDAVATPLGIPYVGKAGKPRPSAFMKVITLMPVSAGEIVVVGDQLLTDVYGAQRLGVRAVLVAPLGRAEPWTSKVQRAVIPRLVKAAGRLVPRRSR